MLLIFSSLGAPLSSIIKPSFMLLKDLKILTKNKLNELKFDEFVSLLEVPWANSQISYQLNTTILLYCLTFHCIHNQIIGRDSILKLHQFPIARFQKGCISIDLNHNFVE